MNNLFNNKDINLSLIGIPILLSISICLYVFSDVTQSIKVLKSIYENAALQLENVFEIGGFVIFVFLILISLMPTASKKINIADRPKFNNIAWCGMMFAAGMGASILFLSPLEWAHTYNASPFLLESSNPLLSKYSQSYPLFHWGFIGWAIFALPAAAFAFGLLKKSDIPLTISALLIKESTPIKKIIKVLIDMTCILAILAGAGVGMGVAFPMIAELLSYLFGFSNNYLFELFILLICLSIFGTSVYLGLSQGIKRLSNINIFLVSALLLTVFIVGPTAFIIKNALSSSAFMMTQFIEMSFQSTSKFAQSWTVFYWAWWMALAPFIGTFLIQISNGKTIRQLILGTIFIGSFASFMHFYVLGGLTSFFFEEGIMDVPSLVKNNPNEVIILQMLKELPLSSILIGMYALIAIIFVCTTYDSCSYVLASIATNKSSKQPPKVLRLIFAGILVIQPGIIMFLEGIDSIKYILVISSIPLLFVFIVLILNMIINVYRNQIS